MKTLGIIGGIAPESTIDYYRQIIASYKEKVRDGSYPQIIINSIDLHKMLELVAANRLAEVTDYLVNELKRLANAGVDLAVFASNTPHLVFEEINRQSPLPLVSIVEATRDEATRLHLTKLGLIGTRFTMQGGFYQNVFSRSGMQSLHPMLRNRSLFTTDT
jgi:aspartate racemase